MSFLTRALPRTTVRAATFTPRAFSTSFVVRKSPVESVKDGLKTVDRAVSDKIVDGIEAGETVADKAKKATGISSTEDIKAKASEVAGQAKGKTAEVQGEAKGKASELAGEAKGKKEEIKGKL
ncbi:lea domain protein [Phlyctema vagabunda]|uniref:Lea domain protein n=1 Tax=Phlyctema vagabunda TaxID=108571 RepID=A0ABR4PTB1_9HELO